MMPRWFPWNSPEDVAQRAQILGGKLTYNWSQNEEDPDFMPWLLKLGSDDVQRFGELADVITLIQEAEEQQGIEP